MICFVGSPEGALPRTILLRRIRRRQLASDPEVVAVFHESTVRVFCSVVTPHSLWNSHACNETLHDGKDGGRTLVAGAVRALEVRGDVHEHNDVPRSPERCPERARFVFHRTC